MGIRLSGEVQTIMKTRIHWLLVGLLSLVVAQAAQAYYNPSTGRWLSRDPLVEAGGRNLYGFVGNDPLAHTDYLGRSLVPPIGWALCKCNLIRPLEVKLATPREILGQDASIGGPADQAIWDGSRSRIWFRITAKFSSPCCQFRQEVRSHTRVGNQPPETDPAFHDDTDLDPRFYKFTAQGIEFSDWDNPGWDQSLQETGGEYFSGWKSFHGFVVDLCNGNKRIGPTLYYGFQAYGKPPEIKIGTWGF